ncbi:hypothetical protein V5P93_003838 [Actinokineospora auranticolor]|uniref:Uncharacterized protein n=1 Tax=Actinokineospora auranticolor TaxID=155976 RepID=A0A2S6GLM7_9PSEU|nr:phage holin family protein [Actinokineospora auranticolor]PPK66125.1 hypothetical protein CLV40_11189 [Actinokineospora auranticolor]
MTQQSGRYAPPHPGSGGPADPGIREVIVSGGSRTGDTAADGLKEVTGQARAQVSDLLDHGLARLNEQARGTQRKVARGLHTTAGHLEDMSENSQKSGVADDVVREIAHRARKVASWLEDREPGDLVEEVREFARRKPGAFLAGAALYVSGRSALRTVDPVPERTVDTLKQVPDALKPQ